jgi:hypothetical protein
MIPPRVTGKPAEFFCRFNHPVEFHEDLKLAASSSRLFASNRLRGLVADSAIAVNRNAAIFTVVDCILRTRHDLLSPHMSLVVS